MAISYETAVKLKEAGWPQYGNNREVDGSLVMVGPKFGDRYDVDCYIPTIEELIEACGKEFRWLKNEKTQWHAQQRQHPASLGDVRAKGSNPTEAVAALWLKLNKKV